jgi:hypothetical protein
MDGDWSNHAMETKTLKFVLEVADKTQHRHMDGEHDVYSLVN